MIMVKGNNRFKMGGKFKDNQDEKFFNSLKTTIMSREDKQKILEKKNSPYGHSPEYISYQSKEIKSLNEIINGGGMINIEDFNECIEELGEENNITVSMNDFDSAYKEGYNAALRDTKERFSK